jgi:molecular chaperone GrpE
MEAAESAPSEGEGQLREGVEIICKQFRDTLNKLGLTEVDAEDVPFDPHVHEAVGREETDEHPEGTVVRVLQKGYLFKDRLLRPSMVSVSLRTGPTGSESSQEDHESEDEAVRHGE